MPQIKLIIGRQGSGKTSLINKYVPYIIDKAVALNLFRAEYSNLKTIEVDEGQEINYYDIDFGSELIVPLHKVDEVAIQLFKRIKSGIIIFDNAEVYRGKALIEEITRDILNVELQAEIGNDIDRDVTVIFVYKSLRMIPHLLLHYADEISLFKTNDLEETYKDYQKKGTSERTQKVLDAIMVSSEILNINGNKEYFHCTYDVDQDKILGKFNKNQISKAHYNRIMKSCSLM